jgi:hypothetical protein
MYFLQEANVMKADKIKWLKTELLPNSLTSL